MANIHTALARKRAGDFLSTQPASIATRVKTRAGIFRDHGSSAASIIQTESEADTRLA